MIYNLEEELIKAIEGLSVTTTYGHIEGYGSVSTGRYYSAARVRAAIKKVCNEAKVAEDDDMSHL